MFMTVEVQKFLNHYTLINIHTTMTIDIILTRETRSGNMKMIKIKRKRKFYEFFLFTEKIGYLFNFLLVF